MRFKVFLCEISVDILRRTKEGGVMMSSEKRNQTNFTFGTTTKNPLIHFR